MLKKIVITVISAIILAASACNGKDSTCSINFNPFYTAPDKIIAGIGKEDKNYIHNYILAEAYSQKKEYKTALLYYANSCFTSRYNFSIRLFPQPIYSFLDSYSSKSPYFSDSVFKIAQIFYQYNEHEYVIKFTSLIKDDGTALFRDAVILKAKSLQRLNRNSLASKELITLAEKYTDRFSTAEIYMRLASVYESSEKFSDALSSYVAIIKSTNEAWYDDIAVKRILYLISQKGVKIADSGSRVAVAEALFNSGNFIGAETLVSDIIKKGRDSAADLLYLKILTHKKYQDSVKFLKTFENRPEYDTLALAHANELWSNGNKYSAVQVYTKIAGSSDMEIAERVLTRLSFYYEERNNPQLIKYMGTYRRLFPDNSQSARFTWLIARYYLKSGNNSNAVIYMKDGIKNYPDNIYTANCRYWLYKIEHQKTNPGENENLIFLQELAWYNPESTHTLSLLSAYAEQKDITSLKTLYNKAKKENNEKRMFLYHTLIFMKEGYNSSTLSRFSDFESTLTKKYKSLNNLFDQGSFKSRFKSRLNSLEKYFTAGDINSVNRELRILPDDDMSVKIDTALAVSRLALKYKYYNYSTFYAFKLLDYMDTQENLPLLSENFARSLYPDAFINCVISESRKNRLQPELVLAMMKAESNFNATAVSPVGAAGLMQLMPVTARGIAKELEITSFDLKDPCTSVKFGAHYIAWLERYYKGSIELMVAGYNAGAGNVNNWLTRFKNKEIDYISEFTPFSETRDYIFRTKKYMFQYRSIYKAK